MATTMAFFFSKIIFIVTGWLLSPTTSQQQQIRRNTDTFRTEIFLNINELDSGLYEGSVKGRRKFGSTQIPHGFGIINYFTDDKYFRSNYSGQWANGTRHGKGTTFFRDGSFYNGNYVNGLEEGEGVITYNNGNLLRGEFSRGQIDGHAVLKYANGDQREGFFKANQLGGQVIYTQANGRTVVELWRDGKRVEDEKEVITDANPVEDDHLDSSSTIDGSSVDSDHKLTKIKTLSDKLKAALRSPDRKNRFVFTNGGGLKGEDNDQSQTVTVAKKWEDVQDLRTDTDDKNTKYLLSVFHRVNGDGDGDDSDSSRNSHSVRSLERRKRSNPERNRWLMDHA